MSSVTLQRLNRAGLVWAQSVVVEHHYLHSPVLARACPEAWGIRVAYQDWGTSRNDWVGCLIVGRPQATACYPWYGSVEDVATGRATCTRWQVLNLARVYLEPHVQHGGYAYRPEWLPGYVDRRGVWRSTLASEALRQLACRAGFDYLLARPPVWLEEPYEIKWLLSYCDSTRHRGVIYRSAGWELYRTNEAGMQTWRTPVAPLTPEQHAAIAVASAECPRARRFRAARQGARAQLELVLGGAA